MRLGGRLAAAIEILDDMDKRRRPAADALKDWGLSHRFAGSGDRSAIGNIVYDALRRRRSAGWLAGEDTPRGQAIGALLLEWGETPDSLNAKLEGDRFAPPPLSQQQAKEIAARDLAAAPKAVRADCPDWCVPLVERTYGADWVREAAALAERPPLDLRVNTLLSSRQAVLDDLREAAPVATALASQGVRIPPIDGSGRHPNVQAEPAFQQGWFEVQDEGSQIVAELAGAAAGMQVLDYCAGAGGKTLALAAIMENSGRVVAHDSEKQRLAPIFDRIRRAGATNIQVVARHADLQDLEGTMDLVLVDAPCTGSGTWRRRPDAKWRLSQRQLEVRMKEQAAILDSASRYVRPGGRIAYITCSIFEEENAGQIAAFRERQTDFACEDRAALWAGRFTNHPQSALIGPLGIALTPARTGTDGFFFSALKRKS